MSIKGVNSDQQMTKIHFGQVLCEAYHDDLEAFESDEVMVGQP